MSDDSIPIEVTEKAELQEVALPDPGDHPCGAGGKPRTRVILDINKRGEAYIMISDIARKLVPEGSESAELQDKHDLEIHVEYEEQYGGLFFWAEGFE